MSAYISLVAQNPDHLGLVSGTCFHGDIFGFLFLILWTTSIFEEHSGVACTNAEERNFCVEAAVQVAESSLIFALIAHDSITA